MKLPTQPRDIETERQALAPYNFVPLPEQIIKLQLDDLPDQSFYHPDRFTGHLDCELITESPVYIRAGQKPEPDQAKKKDAKDRPAFFYLNDEQQPVIPGSSMRGMLRSLVEVVSYSKMTSVSDTPLVYRAVGDTTSHGEHYRNQLMQYDGEQNREKHYTPLIRGGYIVKDGSDWAIRPAKTIGGTTYAHIKIDDALFKSLRPLKGCKNAADIYIETGPYEYQPVRGGFLRIKYARVLRASPNPGSGLQRATLARSGWMNSKRTEAVVYEMDEKASLLSLTDEKIDWYKEQISKEQEDLLGKNGVLQHGQPIFYVMDETGNEVLFFGHARMFRVPYPKNPHDFVPEALRHPEDLDLAEAIFGYTKETGSDKARTYAGRVSISDATLAPEQSDLWLSPRKPVTPKILGSPKPTTFQHYLVQTQPNKFKIGQTRDGEPKYETRLSDYASATPGQTVLRGQKFYWHKGAVKLEDIQENQPVSVSDKQHTQIQPLRAGVKFQFRVNFENLSTVELGALLWVLELATKDTYRLKIGMGKPLGMGAIRLSVRLMLSDRFLRYRQLFDGDMWDEAHLADEDAMRSAVAEFERFVLQSLGEKTARRLEELERIQSLLALLSWPGPDPQKTRYLEIEHADPSAKRGKRNEYKERPVLPTPLSVWGKSTLLKETHTKATSIQSSGGKPLPPGYQRGVVKEFGLGSNQSYGYIQPVDGGADIFVHKSQLAQGMTTPTAGQRVIYKIGKGMNGRIQAQDVRLDQ
jgi:CRISPR-associated protein (TIGR03986 family)